MRIGEKLIVNGGAWGKEEEYRWKSVCGYREEKL